MVPRVVLNDLELDFGALGEITGLVQTVDAVVTLSHVVAFIVGIPVSFKQVVSTSNGVNVLDVACPGQGAGDAVIFSSLVVQYARR